ncbi:IreB family regulatory phosphoprotein [Pseudoflavonifractor phocaeensis]|uniref:IreB family regulatory phosphoprotein n=1 Tax=Pseudoflavonifractor phocaeensis TaxID=1870988 RepID=UPI001F1CDB7E|nr:IreB family regulatory phosphoprotein [Pseudoflavonifractor phocaeensis]MCF2661141.1 IreB family regulatory phosphoprotein [Pseudoflavonifractor phocaeensis]
MDDVLFHQRITEIVRAIKDAGYDPYDQLIGYLKTGEDYYITRKGDARILIKTLDKERLESFVRDLKIKR